MTIIKVGGGETINWNFITDDLASIVKKEQIIIVHGANAKMAKISARLDYPERKIISPSGVQSRYTDAKTIQIFTMVYAGLMNKKIVSILQKKGINAVGLSGVDGMVWQAKRKNALLAKEGSRVKVIRGSFTGKVEHINAKLIQLLLDNDYIPVLSPPAVTKKGEIVNIDSDRAVAVMAGRLKAKKIIFLFEASGFYKDAHRKKSLIHKVSIKQLKHLKKYAVGGMQKKLIACEEAFQYGAEKIYFGDGRTKNPITKTLQGKGTIITSS